MITEFESYPDPVFLLFWGDHLPGLYQGRVKEINSSITQRERPFLIYSNELVLDGDTGMISPIFLNNYIVDILDMEVSPFEALMLRLEENMSVIDRRMLYDNNISEAVTERKKLSPQSLKGLEDYTLLLYDLSTGNNYVDELGFFEYFYD